MGQENEKELFKLYFDLFKHLGTLSVAVPLLVLALYRDLDLASLVTRTSLSAFGTSLVLSAAGVVYAALSVEDAMRGNRQRGTRSVLVMVMLAGLALFLFGVAIF